MSDLGDLGNVGGGCSFAASTLVATPSGERPIGSLKVGDSVLAYNPTTGQSDTEPVQHVWINHDSDLVDVGLRDTTAPTSTSAAVPTSASGPAGTSAKSTSAPSRLSHMLPGVVALGAVALAITLGSAVPAQAPSPTTTATSHTETVHTTANHPWLTVDRGWVAAGELKPGERVVTLGGATETVAWVHVVAGQADMYNLTVAQDHTYAVGSGQAVVHNCNEEAQADLARMRAEMGMSNPQQEDIDVANKVPGASRNTLGRMDFDGGRDSVYGQNGRLPRAYGFPGKGFGIAAKSFQDDAEGDMVSQAMSKGYSGGNATIYTDRVTCPWCQNSMAGYARLLNLDTLTVYGPDGLIGVWGQIGRVP